MAPGCFATPSQELNESESVRPTSKEIPLPAEPAPPLSQIVLLNQHLNKQQIDSFEVLEQTILKQKRLSRLKNTDLRRKILLKRTFDLVCEIMDYENGFEAEADSDEDKRASTNDSSSSESSSDSDTDEESEKHDLNQEPSVKTNLTLVKLDSPNVNHNEYMDLSEIDEENKAQAQVPTKRRASSSDSDEDYSDDESDDYSPREQQLNLVNSRLSSLNTQLNLYSDNRKKMYRKKRRFSDNRSDSLSITLKS